MFSFSHRKDTGWQGEYQTAEEALIAGRATFGEKVKVWIGMWDQAYYADFYIGTETLLSYMRESVSDQLGDEYADSFQSLSTVPNAYNPSQANEVERVQQAAHWVDQLDQAMRNTIGEWETELPPEFQFRGQRITQVAGYAQDDHVRKADFQ